MVWPTRQETWRTTLVVFVFVMALGVFFWLVDMVARLGRPACDRAGRLMPCR